MPWFTSSSHQKSQSEVNLTQEARSFFWVSQGLGPSSTAVPGHKQELEVDQPGHEIIALWDPVACKTRIKSLCLHAWPFECVS